MARRLTATNETPYQKIKPPRKTSTLSVWQEEVARLLKGDQVAIGLNGRNPTSIRTTIRSALLNRGYKLTAKRHGEEILLRAHRLYQGRVPASAKDPNLGPIATNVAMVVTYEEAQRLKQEAYDRITTTSGHLRDILRAYWAGSFRLPAGPQAREGGGD